MTQQQYGYPPQQGGYPDPNAGQYGAPQGYAQAPPNPYGPPPQQYPPAQFVPNGQYLSQQPGYGYPPPQQGPPAVDLSGDLESFYAQRSVGGGKGISWKGVPDGFTVFGVVARTIGHGDVFKETHPPNSPQAGQLRTNRDGSFKYAMQVPLKLLVPLQNYPEGEARLFLRGQLRDDTTRAMAEVGAPEGPPEAGAFVRVTLTHRKPGNNIAQNMFSVLYRSPGTWEQDPNILQMLQQAQAPQQAPQPAQAPVQGVQGYGAPQQAPYVQGQFVQHGGQAQQAYPNPQQVYNGATGSAEYGAPPQAAPNQYAQPQYGQQAYDPNQHAQALGLAQSSPQYPGGAPNQGQAAQAPVQGVQAQPAPNPQYAVQGQPPAPNTQAPAGAVNPGDQTANPNPQYAQQGQQMPLLGVGHTDQGPAGGVGSPQPLPGMPNPNQLPVQNGVQPSGLDPAKQALLARVTGQGQPAGNPQQ